MSKESAWSTWIHLTEMGFLTIFADIPSESSSVVEKSTILFEEKIPFNPPLIVEYTGIDWILPLKKSIQTFIDSGIDSIYSMDCSANMLEKTSIYSGISHLFNGFSQQSSIFFGDFAATFDGTGG